MGGGGGVYLFVVSKNEDSNMLGVYTGVLLFGNVPTRCANTEKKLQHSCAHGCGTILRNIVPLSRWNMALGIS